MKFLSALALLPLLLCARGAAAQSINIDVGPTAGSNPFPNYGGAAAQPGTWNWFDVNPALLNVPRPMSSLTGAVTGVSMRFTAGLGGNFSFNHPATVGGDEALLDDVHDIGPGLVARYEIAGLAATGYWVYTYAWAPDNVAFRTEVSVAGSYDPPQRIGGAWPGAQRYQVTFAKHFVVVPPGGLLTIEAKDPFAPAAGNHGSVCGFQLRSFADFGCDGEPDFYCTGKVNSAGCLPVIGSIGGPPSMGACGCGFAITASNVLSNKTGQLFYSLTGPQATPFSGGTMCVAGPRFRGPAQNSGGAGACGGSFTLDFNARIALHNANFPAAPISAGDSVWAQWYYRDPTHADGSGTGLTDALHFTICF